VLETIQATLTDFSQRDYRLHYCQLDADRLENNRCTLSGVILDAAALTEVVDELQTRFPTISFKAADVKVLSSPEQKKLTVATNVTAVMSEPSWRSEQMSQVLNGWQVERLMEQEGWVFVRQMRDNGYLGWVYRDYLSDETPPVSTHMVYQPTAVLYAEPSAASAQVGRVWAGMEVAVTDVSSVTAVSGDWAQLSLAGGVTGWLPQAILRSLDELPRAEETRRQQIVNFANQLIGVPYLWGGRTALGIDCSGLAELAYRLSGVTIPRDADMQFAAGQAVEPPFTPGDLLFFGSDRGHRAISHVGISLGDWRIVHSSRSRNGVYLDDVQAVASLKNSFMGARTFLP
jgi:gamma-D-glutamyl-L-lysine dipeptidyl-peptidase